MRAAYEFDVEDFQNPDAKRAKDFVRFYLRPQKNEEKSIAEGRPVHDLVEYVEIYVPGNDNNRPNLRVTDVERKRYAQQYQAWKASGEAESKETGTFLTEVPWIDRAQVEDLAYFKIRTLEQLASVSDTVCQKHMGMFELRRRAQAALESARNAAPLLKLQKELDDQKAENATLSQSLEAALKRLDALEKKAK